MYSKVLGILVSPGILIDQRVLDGPGILECPGFWRVQVF